MVHGIRQMDRLGIKYREALQMLISIVSPMDKIGLWQGQA